MSDPTMPMTATTQRSARVAKRRPKKGMKDGLFWHGSTYWMQYRYKGRTVRESTGCTTLEAAKAVRDAKRTASRERRIGAPESMGDLFHRLLAWYALKNRRSRPKLKHLVSQFDVEVNKAPDGTVRYSGGKLATDVDADEVDRYAKSRRDEDGAAEATVANKLRALRTAFRLAKKRGKLATIPEFEIEEPQNTRQCFFTVEQLDRLVTFLPDHLKAPVRFAALTGWRAGNIFGLTWDHVDDDRGEVRTPIGVTKTGEPFNTLIARGSELERLLRERKQSKRGPWVFHRNGGRIKSYGGSWRTAVKKLGADGYGWQGSKRVLKRFHDLRHTFAQLMTDADVPEAVIRELGTWKTRSAFERYKITRDEAKRQAVAQMEQHIEAERKRAAIEKVLAETV